jgi:hypothetical protein
MLTRTNRQDNLIPLDEVDLDAVVGGVIAVERAYQPDEIMHPETLPGGFDTA